MTGAADVLITGAASSPTVPSAGLNRDPAMSLAGPRSRPGGLPTD